MTSLSATEPRSARRLAWRGPADPRRTTAIVVGVILALLVVPPIVVLVRASFAEATATGLAGGWLCLGSGGNLRAA